MHVIHHNQIAAEPVSHDPEISKKVILRRGLIENIAQVSLTTLLPGQGTSPHEHTDLTEIYTLLEGSLVFNVNGSEASVSSPATVVVNSGENHSVRNADGAIATFLYTGIETRGAIQ